MILEELEIEQAAEAADDDGEDTSSEADAPKPPRAPRKRKPFPKGLKRVQKTITPSETCEDCGGSFKELGVDVMDELEYVPGHYIVNQIGRPRLACTCCEKVVQAEMPSRPIPKSFVGPALMAHILCCKYGYHLPLYRQSQMFENEGIDLSGSLMAGWVGKCTQAIGAPGGRDPRSCVSSAGHLHGRCHGQAAAEGQRARQEQDQNRAAVGLCPR